MGLRLVGHLQLHDPFWLPCHVSHQTAPILLSLSFMCCCYKTLDLITSICTIDKKTPLKIIRKLCNFFLSLVPPLIVPLRLVQVVWASVFVKLDWSFQIHLVLLLSVQRGGVAYYCRGLTNCHVTHLPILLGWSVQLNKFATLHIIFAAKIMHRLK